MKIAYVCADPGVPVFGCKGCSIHVQEMIRVMIQSGAQVHLFPARIGGEPPDDLRQCVVHELPLDRSESVLDREINQVRWNRRIARVLEGQKFDLVYERHSIWNMGAMKWAKSKGIPSVLEVNAPLIDEQTEHRGLVQRRLAENLTRWAMDLAGAIYVVSSEIVPYCQRFLPDDRHVAVIPNGVNTNRFSPSVTPAVNLPEFTIGFVGSLKPWHGIDELLEAFEVLNENPDEPASRLLIVGDGPRRNEIRAFVNGRPHLKSQVRIAGAVTPNEVPAWLTSMDVAVAPYPDNENFYFSPLKLFEYMSAGRAIVASSAGQIPKVVSDGQNGLLYQPGNARQLANCLRRLRDDSTLVADLGVNARRDALPRDWSHVLDRVLQLAGLSSKRNEFCDQTMKPVAYGESLA